MPYRFALLAAAFAVCSLPIPAIAQVPGDLDPDFGTLGSTVVDITVDGDPRANSATGILIQPDGRIVMGGAATLIGAATGPERMVLVRLNSDGTVNSGFGSNGRVRIDGLTGQSDESYYDGRVALAHDGGIYLFSGSQDAGGVIGWVLAKVTTAGALDGGFGTGGRVTDSGNEMIAGEMVVQADGKPLVLDDFLDTAPNPDNRQMEVTRFLTGGGLDPDFGVGGRRVVSFDLGATRNDFSRTMMVQADGRILVAGNAEVGTVANPNPDFAIARLTADGDLDTTFSGDGKLTIGFDLPFGNFDEVRALAVDAAGRIYAGGLAGNFNTANDCAIVRLLPDGTLDTTFSGDGKFTFSFASAVQSAFDQIFGIALQGNGRAVVVGRGTNSGGGGRTAGVARLTAAGALDPTFAGDGTVVYSFASGGGTVTVGRAMALAEDGSIVLSGFTQPAAGDNAFFAAQLYNDYVFADAFESGDLALWSLSTP